MTLESMTEEHGIPTPAAPAAKPAGGKPCVALMGEFSAGKTTLVNFLVGEEILPTRVTATQMPPVWITYGEGEPSYVDTEGVEHPLDIERMESLPVEGVRYVRLFSEAELLRGIDLIDTPGISDPNIPDYHRDTVTENATAVIWCTHATQAWRESERSTWEALPEALRARGILLATRADKLDETGRMRVKKRLAREAGEDFSAIVMFSALDAIAGAGEGEDSTLFATSGGRELLDRLHDLADETGQAAGDSPEAEAPVSAIRPVRISRANGPGRGRISAEEAESMRSELMDAPKPSSPRDELRAALVQDEKSVEDEEAQEEGTADSSDILILESPESLPGTSPANDHAEPDICLEDETPEGAPADEDKYSFAEEGKEGLDRDHDDADEDELTATILPGIMSSDHEDAGEESAEAAEAGIAADQGTLDEARPDPAPAPSARALWDEIRAEAPVETVADLLDTFERFIDEMDRRGAFFAARGEQPGEDGEDSGWRLLG